MIQETVVTVVARMTKLSVADAKISKPETFLLSCQNSFMVRSLGLHV